MLLEVVLGGPVGGTLSSGLKKYPNALCRVLSIGWDVKRVSRLSEVIKDPMALIVIVWVLTPVAWLKSQSGPRTIAVT